MRVVILLAAALFAFAVSTGSAAADSTHVGLTDVSASTSSDGSEVTETIASAPAGTIYRTVVQCTQEQAGGACYNPRTCLVPAGTLRYDVLKSTDNGATFTKVSETCLGPDADADAPPQVTPAMVATAFQNLTWPGSPIKIQPPGGRTLVNLATNFRTTNTSPTTQTVTLLGQSIDIEATPTTWTWHHGDGTTQTSTGPGREYPHLDIAHTYGAVARLEPSVDTTYAGRYRLAGGPWVDIPDTVTVIGDPSRLEVLTATPKLVAAD